MAVVPGDKLGGRPRPGQILARDSETSVGLSADGVDHGVVQAHEVGVMKVAADVDVAEEAEAGPLGDPLVDPRHGLDLRMVGRHAEPDEAPGRGQPLDQIDLNRRLGRQQSAGGIEARGTRADDRNAHGGDARGSA